MSYDIFISFHHKDSVTNERTRASYLAEDLYNGLERRGYKVFFAPRSLKGKIAENYIAEINAALESARVLVLIYSTAAELRQEWVEHEWSFFYRSGKKMIPVMLDVKREDWDNIPRVIRTTEGFDLSDDPTDSEFTELLGRISGVASKKHEQPRPEPPRYNTPQPAQQKIEDFIYTRFRDGGYSIKIKNAPKTYTDVVIPSEYKGEPVKEIGYQAFNNCTRLKSITIPSSVRSIDGYAFWYCSSLASITIPSSVTSIGDWAFSGCSSLARITIPSSVTSIGDCAFWGCSSLASITIPSSVTSIGDSAFYGCSSLASVTIPSSVTSIGHSAFSWCSSLARITIPDSVTSIGYSAFRYCSSLASVTIPSSVTSIDDEAFWGCSSLASITIPSSVTSIGWRAFRGCSSLASIFIPSSVTSIGKEAFKTHTRTVIYAKQKPSYYGYKRTIREKWC